MPVPLLLKLTSESTIFNYLDSDPLQETDWQSFGGFSFKGGVNYNLTDNHNVFFNAGYMETQPDFDAVFLNYENFINEEAENEKITTLEVGYGYRSATFKANIGGFYTLWKDKTETDTYRDADDAEYSVNILGIGARHMGVEVDFNYSPNSRLTVTGMASIGDYIWQDNGVSASVTSLENTDNTYELERIYIDGLHVGDAAQTTAALGITYEFLPDFKLGLDYTYSAKLFADFDPVDITEDIGDVWELPEFGLLDGSFSYKFKLAGLDAAFRGKVDNILNTEYFSEADSYGVFYGWGRTWSSSLKINF